MNNDDTPPDSSEAAPTRQQADNVINLADRFNAKSTPKESEVKRSLPTSGTYNFVFFSQGGDGSVEDSAEATGFLKFGPQFLAVVDGPEDEASVVFACSTPTVKYIRKVTDRVQGELPV